MADSWNVITSTFANRYDCVGEICCFSCQEGGSFLQENYTYLSKYMD